jgi:hypothetical protein
MVAKNMPELSNTMSSAIQLIEEHEGARRLAENLQTALNREVREHRRRVAFSRKA